MFSDRLLTAVADEMPDLPLQPHDWSSLTPIGVCLGLLTLLVTCGIPWLLVRHSRDMSDARKEFLAALDKEVSFRNSQFERSEQERKRIIDGFEATLREITQQVGRRRG